MTAKHIASLDTNAQTLVTDSIAWMDQYWDERAGLLWSPGDRVDPHHPHPVGPHIGGESGWYALGLLLRNTRGDLERAIRFLDTILSYQFDEPSQPYHGTFYRALEE